MPISCSLHEGVECAAPQCPLSDQDYQELSINVDPLDYTSEFGIELYCQSVDFVALKMST